MAARVPARLKWAVDVLEVQAGERILEIGCGRGVAVELICECLGDGRITCIDRSPVAIAAAEARNRTCMQAGKARLLNVALADAKLDEPFDKVFAVNVNVFWLGPEKELAVIHRVLASGGRLYLFYEPPSEDQLSRVSEACREFLQEAGFTVNDEIRAELGLSLGFCIVAQPSDD